MKIAIVGKFPPKTYDILNKELGDSFEIEIIDTQDKLDSLSNADIIILRIFKLLKKDLKHIDNLKLIEKWGTGYDTIDIKYATEREIRVCNVPGANAHIVAEITILHILNLFRNFLKHNEEIRKGSWTKTEFIETTYSLKNKKVGLIGGGNIAREVAKRLKGFDCEINYYDILKLDPDIEKKYNMKYIPFDKLIETSDVISIHVPLFDSTRNLITKNEINKMKKTVILINTSRGGIINEKDLIEALETNRIMGAGLDAFETEPLVNLEMTKFKNLSLTPHVGGTSYDLVEIMLGRIMENIMRFKNGEEIKNCIN